MRSEQPTKVILTASEQSALVQTSTIKANGPCTASAGLGARAMLKLLLDQYDLVPKA